MGTKVLPRLLAVSDRRSLTEPFESWLHRLRAAEAPMVQIREKDLDDRALLRLVIAARRELPPPCLLLVNERADIALAAGADGVHLPSSAAPTAALRRRFGDSLLLGRSTHCLEEVTRESQEGADYVTFGPVYATASKAAYGPPLGLEALAAAARISLRVFALGGVQRERMEAVAATGAWGVAGIGLMQAADLEEVVSTATAVFSQGSAADATDGSSSGSSLGGAAAGEGDLP